MSRILTILLGLIAFILLVYFCVQKHRYEIENDLVTRTRQALIDEHEAYAIVDTDGRELVLTGIAPDKMSRHKAGEIAHKVWGVRTVDNQIIIAEPQVAEVEPTSENIEPPARSEPEPIPHFEVKDPQPLDSEPAMVFPSAPAPYRTEIEYENGKLKLSGYVADESSRLWLIKKIKDQFGSENVDDNLEIGYGAPQGWHRSINVAIDYLNALQHGKIVLEDNNLNLTGHAGSERIADQVKHEVSESIDANFTSHIDITAEQPEPIPVFEITGPQPLDTQPAASMPAAPQSYRTEAIFNSGELILSGFLPDQAAKVWLVNLAEEKYGKGKVSDQTTIAYGAPQGWHATIAAAVVNLKSLEKGEALLENNDLTVSGIAPSTEIKTQVELLISEGVMNYQGNYQITAPEPDATCQQKFNELLADKQILFNTDEAIIKEESFVLLDQLINVSKGCPDAKIEIVGHTDDRGPEEYNQWLSENRAKAVATYMREHGVTTAILSAIGYGESQPVADNATPEGMAKNRRIEFKVEGN